jgi:hypothetical protein
VLCFIDNGASTLLCQSATTGKRKEKKYAAVLKRKSKKSVRMATQAERVALASMLNEDVDVRNEDVIEEVDDIIEEEEECKWTMEERIAMGLLVVSQEQMHVAIWVLYVAEYEEPEEDKWAAIIEELST